jgi:hypothetical protein
MTLVFSVGTVQRGWVGASGFKARRNMLPLLKIIAYLYIGIRIAILSFAALALLYVTISPSTKSSVFIRVCNGARSLALMALMAYLYLRW